MSAAESLALIWKRTRIENSLSALRPRKRLTLLKVSQVTMRWMPWLGPSVIRV